MNLRSLIPVGLERSPASQPFLSLQREIDRLFDDFTRGFPVFSCAPGTVKLMPVTDVTESDKEIEITAELPGLEEQDVQINLADNVLTIRGEMKAREAREGQELPHGRTQLRCVRAVA
jgi:HSP20 family protein